MFVMCMCFFLLRCSLIECISVNSVFMWFGVFNCVKVMSFLMYVMMPPPLLFLSVRIGTKLVIFGVL